MKIIKNEKLIQRNGKIANYTSIVGMVALGISMYYVIQSFTEPEKITPAVQLITVVGTGIGFILTQISMYLGKKFGRSPRPDEKIDAGLKGLHSEFNLFHYSSPISHLLVGPSGVWALLPYHQGAKISFEKNRWKASGGGALQGYMRIFAQEGIGRPDIDAENEVRTLNKFFAKNLDESFIPEVKPILLFTNDRVELNAGDSPIPAMKIKQLKEFMRQGGKNRVLSTDQIEKVTSLFDAS